MLETCFEVFISGSEKRLSSIMDFIGARRRRRLVPRRRR
jgi:hypothetical protein